MAQTQPRSSTMQGCASSKHCCAKAATVPSLPPQLWDIYCPFPPKSQLVVKQLVLHYRELVPSHRTVELAEMWPQRSSPPQAVRRSLGMMDGYGPSALPGGERFMGGTDRQKSVHYYNSRCPLQRYCNQGPLLLQRESLG